MANSVYPSQVGVNNDFKRYPWAAHTAWGYPFNLLHNVIEHTFAYTHHKKKVSAGTAAAVHASISGSSSAQTITTGIVQPDVPRVLAVTLGGTGFAAGTVTIKGYNVEGKPISDVISYTSSTGQFLGSLVFKYVTEIDLLASLGASATVTVDTLNKIGLNHRCPSGYTTIVVVHDNALDIGAAPTHPVAEAAPSGSNVDGEFVEKNWVTPATTLNGTNFLYFFYWFHKVLVYPPKDSPEFYSTTTSTSSTSTSTTTSSTSSSTSISSTSTSISSTSTSTTQSTSTSISTTTSSTSTSTTTLPI